MEDIPSLEELLGDSTLELDAALVLEDPPAETAVLKLPTLEPPRRKRRKDELEYLRVKTRELELQLTELQSREVDEDVGTAMWRRVARRQLEGKKRAEKENASLRGLVEAKLAIIQSLEKVLRKRAAMEADELVGERKRARMVNESERTIFDRLRAQLDQQYTDTDAVFRENAHAARREDGNHVQVKPDGSNGMFMEFLSTKTLPFGADATATQFWHSLAQPRFKLRDGQYSLSEGTEDTLAAKMAFTIDYKRHQVLKDAWFVVKRFVESDRHVFVWACETTTEGTLSAAQSLRLRDSGWTLVERFTGEGADDSGLESSIVRSCVRVTTELPDAMPHSHEEVMLLTEIVTGSYLENLDGIHQFVEDSLVDKALQ